MKKFLLAALSALTVFTASAQSGAVLEKPVVDRRVELLSIVFRLAGRPEYSDIYFKAYIDRIERHFGAYKDHELIRFARTLPLGYDAPMLLAVHLNDRLELIADAPDDARWDRESVEKFLPLLRQFAAESDFDRFFAENADFYAVAAERFQPVYEALNPDWFRRFYGQGPNETFRILLAMGNGGQSYGVQQEAPDGTRNVYSISAAGSDREGLPTYPVGRLVPLMIHEFNHSFVNRLIDENRSKLEGAGEKLFAVVGGTMKNQAYTEWETMMSEALVRAAVIQYAKHNGGARQLLNQMIAEEQDRGFFWIGELVNELDNYDRGRETYPTLESYMPRIIALYRDRTDEWIGQFQETERLRPQVVSIAEFENGAQEVDPALKTITIHFDRPLSGQGYSIYNGPNTFPKTEKVIYANENRSVVMQVALEPDTEYGFILKGTLFRSLEGAGMKDYTVTFKTRK